MSLASTGVVTSKILCPGHLSACILRVMRQTPIMQTKFSTEKAWEDTPTVADKAVRKLLVLGDIHGEAHTLRRAIELAHNLGCDVVVQVGDFWLVDETAALFPYTRTDHMRVAYESPLPVVVVDGNHEVWPALENHLESLTAPHPHETGLPLHLGGSLWWAVRGSVWQWAGLAFGALGGAASPDREIPSVRSYRWAAETTTREDLDRLLHNAPDSGLDVLLTHDAPEGVDGLVSGLNFQMPRHLEEEAKGGQRLLREAVDATNPHTVFHGHWHQSLYSEIGARPTDVFSLAENGSIGSMAVVTLEPEWSVEIMSVHGYR